VSRLVGSEMCIRDRFCILKVIISFGIFSIMNEA
jgi:hypothetical protein